MSTSRERSRDDLRQSHQLACPACGQAETLSIEVRCTIILSAKDIEAHKDYEWDDAACCFCDDCGHNGTVGEFRITPQEQLSARRFEHVFTLAFSFTSDDREAHGLSPLLLRRAALSRLETLSDEELIEAVEGPFEIPDFVQTSNAERP